MMKSNDLKFNFEDLLVYQKSLDFVDSIYTITKKFPKEEEFRLISQFVRAAHSIALNIADGSGGTKAEFRFFLKNLKTINKRMHCLPYNCKQAKIHSGRNRNKNQNVCC
jgi:hypothetical protein